MVCTPVKMPNGLTAIVCHKPRRRKCVCCGERSTLLCDFELAPGKTCDKPLCTRCAVSVGPDLDHCPTHQATKAAPAPRQLGFDL